MGRERTAHDGVRDVLRGSFCVGHGVRVSLVYSAQNRAKERAGAESRSKPGNLERIRNQEPEGHSPCSAVAGTLNRQIERNKFIKPTTEFTCAVCDFPECRTARRCSSRGRVLDS